MKLYVLSGEDSGDLHAGNVLAALRGNHPDWQFRGIGGDRMIAQGLSPLAHIRDVNFMGFIEVAKHLGTIRKLFRKVKADMQAWKPNAVLLVDYPGFNLRMAPFIKQELGIPIIYFISPQLWAWKKGRVKTIRKYVDRMLVILPFEEDFYARENVRADFVGHPLLDVIPSLAEREPEPGLVALLPGSRKQEIRRILPVMLEMPSRFPNLNFVIAGAPSQPESLYRDLMGNCRVDFVHNKTYDLLARAETALVTSGTATLETGLFGVPEAVLYKADALSYSIGKRLVDVKYISLVNLILDRPAIPELIQQDCTPDTVARTLESLQAQETRKRMVEALAELRARLGETGAAARAAAIIQETLAAS